MKYKNIICKICGKDQTLTISKNSETLRCKPCFSAKNKKEHRENPKKELLFGAQKRARDNLFICSITEQDIIIPKFCPILNISLNISDTGFHGINSPTIDKIFNNCGYQPGNIVVISHRANVIKKDANLFEISQTFINYNKISNNPSIYFTESEKKRLFRTSKKSAKKRGIDFTIKITDILIPDFCPVLGIRLHYKDKNKQVSIRGKCPNSPSIDRIDNSKGYEKGNVRVISWRANWLKTDSSYVDYMRVFAFYCYILPTYKLEYRQTLKRFIDNEILLSMPDQIIGDEGPCVMHYNNKILDTSESGLNFTKFNKPVELYSYNLPPIL